VVLVKDQYVVLVGPLKSGASPPLPPGETGRGGRLEWQWIPYAVEQAGGSLDGQTVTVGAYESVVFVKIGSEELSRLTLALAEQTVGEPVVLRVEAEPDPVPAKGGSG
jgi:hypothetical protein